MKMNKLISTAAVLALIGLASVGTASAQSFSQGDLILSFRLNNVTSGGQNLEVDLGSAVSFNFAANNASIANLSADLNTVYGASWATNSNLVYSVVAGTGSISGNQRQSNNIFISSPGNALPIDASTPAGGTTNEGVLNNLYTVSGATALTVGYEISTNSSSSYTDVLTNYDAAQGGSAYTTDYDYGLGSGFGGTESALGSSSDLYEQAPISGHGSTSLPASSTDLGTFEVGTNGVVSFSAPVAVPEPASYVLGGIAGVLFFILRRRSKIQA